jgi:putative ABC transport system permease protein
MKPHDLMLRLRTLMHRRQAERDLEEELDFHIEMQTRKNVAAGMTGSEAARRARIQFGGATQHKEECRDARRVGLVETVWQDVRYAIRGFRRSPTFVLTVVATIALGLGLNTALFTIFNTTYFRPIGVRDPHSLYEFVWRDRAGASHDFTWPEYLEFLTSNPAFSEVLVYRHTQARWDGRTVLGTLVTSEYFRVLGVGAALGRTLLPEDSPAPGREPVMVLSYRAWQSRFLADPDIVGKKVLLRGYPFEVVGVAHAGFAGLGSRPSEFWVPLSMAARFEAGPDLFGSEHPRALSMVGRLKRGFSVRQAQAGLTLWVQRFTAAAPNPAKAVQAILFSRATTKPLNVKNALAFSPILVAFSLVLLIGCANVANMMLARSMSRQREIGIRLSLGAARGRLIRQLLTESILLAVPSAIAGVAVSQATIRVCSRVLAATLPPGVSDFANRIPDLTSDIRVFGFTLAAALVSAIMFGLAPAIQATRSNIMQAAKGDFTHDSRSLRFRSALVVSQVAVCALLLITAGILLGGVDRIHSLETDLGTRNTIEIAVQEKSREAILNRLPSEPSVAILAAARSAPVDRKPMVPVGASEDGIVVDTAANYVSPEYFALFEIPIVRGRNFSTDEARSGAPVAIISQTAAQRLWPNQVATGRSLRLISDRRPVNIIGIARDEISRWIANGEDKSLVYFPSNPRAAGNKLYVGVHSDAEAARRKIEADLTAIDPNAVEQIRRLQIREWVAEDADYTMRVAYWLSSAIGLLALLLTLSGIYGVVSYVISQRTKEIGIRMALGATSHAVTGLVLKQSIRLAVLGALWGSVLAMAVSKILAAGLVMIHTFDGAAYIGGVVLVLAACAMATYFPSRRAVRIDPLITLRYD